MDNVLVCQVRKACVGEPVDNGMDESKDETSEPDVVQQALRATSDEIVRLQASRRLLVLLEDAWARKCSTGQELDVFAVAGWDKYTKRLSGT